MERGLLDLSVELSTRDLTAGNEFTLFVLVKNPFDKPVWIRLVDVSLPSDLEISSPRKESLFASQNKLDEERKKKLEAQSKNLELATKQAEILEQKLIDIDQHLDITNSNSGDLDSLLRDTRFQVNNLQQAIQSIAGAISQISIRGIDSAGDIVVESEVPTELSIKDIGSIGDLIIDTPATLLSLGGNPESTTTGDINIVGGPSASKQQVVKLESSLPINTALQPGSTAVYRVPLRVKKPLLFTPSQYRLQFNVNYAFAAKIKQAHNVEQVTGEPGLFTNTISSELSIRSSVYSVILGAILGGLIGAITQILQTNSYSQVSVLENAVKIIVAVALSIMAIVFLARKSDAQSIATVEDFWGGVLIGFLVAYSGTTFFASLTGVTAG